MNDDNIHDLKIKPRLRSDDKPPLKVVRNFKCLHDRIEVDEELAEVMCLDCKEKLNPVAVLARFAKHDDRLFWQREQLRQEVESYKDKLRFKCGYCGQTNNIAKPLRTRVERS